MTQSQRCGRLGGGLGGDLRDILSSDTDLKITQDFKKVKLVICLSDAAGDRVK